MGKKLMLEEVKKCFEEVGYTPLFTEYKVLKDKLPVICNKGHKVFVRLDHFRQGVRCGICFGPRKFSVEEAKEKFLRLGYTPLFTEYVNAQMPLSFSCDKGHKATIRLDNLKSGKRCIFCAKNKPVSFEEAQGEFISRGFKPLFSSYINIHEPLSFQCSNNHYHQISLGNLRHGQGCGKCVGGRKFTFQEVKKFFTDVGYTPLFDKYINSSGALSFRCDEGHTNSMCLRDFNQGHRCSICYGNKKISLEEARDSFFDVGYTPLFDSYDNNSSLLPFICDSGHEHQISLANLRQGKRCYRCSKAFSKAEKELVEIVKNLGFVVEENTNKIISPFELDLFVPEKNVAVEYCGLYWHSEVSGRKNDSYHYHKRILCQQRGVRLLTVFEDEYLNCPGVVMSRIENALGSTQKRVYGRSCVVKEIPKATAKEFLSSYHLQGHSNCSISFGIFYKDRLLGVMTAGSLSRQHVTKEKTLELKRLCFLPSYSIVGGASKLFKLLLSYAVKKGFKCLRSYQDMRYGNPFSPVYEKLGFSLIAESKYTPHYVSKDYKLRYRNQALRKTPEERKTGKTEWQLRREQGYDRIWDCGHRTYEYTINYNI